MSEKPKPFIEKTSLVLIISLVALGLAGIALYNSQNTDTTRLDKIENQLNNTDKILGVVVNSRSGPTAFDQDVLSWANQTNFDIHAIKVEIGMK